MGYVLGEGLSFCIVLDRFVFLDLRHDRYFCLGAEAGAGFARVLQGTGAGGDEVIDRLVASGVIRPGGHHARPKAVSHEAPSRSLVRSRSPRAPLGTLEALSRRLGAEAALRVRGLDACIAAAGHRVRGLPYAGADAAAGAAAAFARSALLRAKSKRCVSISLAAMRWFAARGSRADLVIGVKLHPFEAHCWVQIGDTLINDEVDAVRPFVPILVV